MQPSLCRASCILTGVVTLATGSFAWGQPRDVQETNSENHGAEEQRARARAALIRAQSSDPSAQLAKPPPQPQADDIPAIDALEGTDFPSCYQAIDERFKASAGVRSKRGSKPCG